MRRFPYIGDAPGKGVSGGLGGVLLASASPGPGYTDVNLLTDAQVAKLRAAGALPKTPSVFKNNTLADGATTNLTSSWNWGSNVTSPRRWAVGGGSMAVVPSAAGGGVPAIGWIADVRAQTAMGSIFGSVSFGIAGTTAQAIGYCNGEFNILASDGLYAFSPRLAAPTVTKYGTAAPGGATGYNQISYVGGRWVIWSDSLASTANPPKYSTDRVTWTACTFPQANNAANNATGSAIQGGAIDPTTGYLVLVSDFGEVFYSSDGITFTKSVTRAGGSASLGLSGLCILGSGKLASWNQGLTAGQLYMAASYTSAFAVQTITLPNSKVFVGPIAWAAYSHGIFAVIDASANMYNVTADCGLAFSYDEGVSFTNAACGDGTYGTGTGASYRFRGVFADQGVFYAGLVDLSTGQYWAVLQRWFTDAQRALYETRTDYMDLSGSALKAWIKTQ